jgi:hypothetical protein
MNEEMLLTIGFLLLSFFLGVAIAAFFIALEKDRFNGGWPK